MNFIVVLIGLWVFYTLINNKKYFKQKFISRKKRNGYLKNHKKIDSSFIPRNNMQRQERKMVTCRICNTQTTRNIDEFFITCPNCGNQYVPTYREMGIDLDEPPEDNSYPKKKPELLAMITPKKPLETIVS